MNGAPQANTARYTPGYSANAAAFMSSRTAESHAGFFLPYLRPGMRVLDCGCGPGTITLDLARRVHPGFVTGVDIAAGQIALAEAAAIYQGVANVLFRSCSIEQMTPEDEPFDAAFSHALLEHLADPVASLRRVRSLLKPGGVIGVCSPDWRGFLVAPSSPALTEAIEFYQRLQRENGGSVDAGGRLGEWLEQAGFSNVRMAARYECYANRTHIGEYLAQRIEQAEAVDGAVTKGWIDPEGPQRLTQTLRMWQRQPSGLFAQAWVSAIGWA